MRILVILLGILFTQSTLAVDPGFVRILYVKANPSGTTGHEEAGSRLISTMNSIPVSGGLTEDLRYVIQLEPGRYRLLQPLTMKQNIEIRGAGRFNTVLDMSALTTPFIPSSETKLSELELLPPASPVGISLTTSGQTLRLKEVRASKAGSNSTLIKSTSGGKVYVENSYLDRNSGTSGGYILDLGGPAEIVNSVLTGSDTTAVRTTYYGTQILNSTVQVSDSTFATAVMTAPGATAGLGGQVQIAFSKITGALVHKSQTDAAYPKQFVVFNNVLDYVRTNTSTAFLNCKSNSTLNNPTFGTFNCNAPSPTLP